MDSELQRLLTVFSGHVWIQSAPTVDVVLSLTAMGKSSAPTVDENVTLVFPQS